MNHQYECASLEIIPRPGRPVPVIPFVYNTMLLVWYVNSLYACVLVRNSAMCCRSKQTVGGFWDRYNNIEYEDRMCRRKVATKSRVWRCMLWSIFSGLSLWQPAIVRHNRRATRRSTVTLHNAHQGQRPMMVPQAPMPVPYSTRVLPVECSQHPERVHLVSQCQRPQKFQRGTVKLC